jgi:dTDP-4-amino-4,6-dideoxygalactose transaminase
MLNTPLSPWPCFTDEEADAVANVLRSNRVNYWTGQEGRVFEKEFATWVGTRHAIALTNGTVALDLALHGLGVGSVNGGLATDEVIVTPRTFLASVSSVVNAGAIPVFADVDRDSGNISAQTIAPMISANTKCVIPVHLAGWPCDMDPIMELAAHHGFSVIEDCAQAHGARHKGRSVGSIGHVGAWSFCQDKIMTTGGEGGMVTCNDPDLWSRMWSFKDHGKSWEAVYEREHAPGFRWLHESFGTNWRMLEMQAVIGRIQLGRMSGWTERRTEIANRIADVLRGFPAIVRVPLPPEHSEHAFYRCYAYVSPEGLGEGWTRDRIVAECTARGAPTFQGSCSEVYQERAFDGTPWRPSQRLLNASLLGDTSMMFLTHPNIDDSQLDAYCATIGTVMNEASS